MKLAVSILITIILTACGDQENTTQQTGEKRITPISSTPKPSTEHTALEVLATYPQSTGVLAVKLAESETNNLKPYLPAHYTLVKAQLSAESARIQQQLEPLVSTLFKELNTHKTLEKEYIATQPAGTTYTGIAKLPEGAALDQHKQRVAEAAADITKLKTSVLNTLYASLIPSASTLKGNALSLKQACAANHLFVEANKMFKAADNNNAALTKGYEEQSDTFKLAFPKPELDNLMQTAYVENLYKQAKIGVKLKLHTLDRFVIQNLNQHFFSTYEAPSYLSLNSGVLSKAGATILNNTLAELAANNIANPDLPQNSYNTEDELDLNEGGDAIEWFAADYFRVIPTIFTKNPTLANVGQHMLEDVLSKLEFTWNSKAITKRDTAFYRNGETSAISELDTKKLGAIIINSLRTDPLLASILKDPKQSSTALSLSNKPMLGFVTPHTHRAARLNKHNGCFNFSQFKHNQQFGTQHTLQNIPLNVTLSGHYSAKTKGTVQFLGLYHIGNAGVGIKGGYTNAFQANTLTKSQTETSFSMFYNSPQKWFVEASIGSTAVQHALFSTVFGHLHSVTIGYDASWVTPFISTTHRYLSLPAHNKDALSYKVTAGIESQIVTRQQEEYNVTGKAFINGSYLSNGDVVFKGGFEAGLMLKTGVSVKSNFRLSTNNESNLELQLTLQL